MSAAQAQGRRPRFSPHLQRGRALAPAMLCAALLAVSAAARAQAPSAGDVLRETAPPLIPLPEGRIPALVSPEPEDRALLRDDAGLKVRASVFRITGASVLPEAELQALLADLIGRDLTYAGLREAADRITRRYRERGYLLARAWLPAQNLGAGEIEIAVLEGRLGDIRLENRSAYNEADVIAFLDPNRLNDQVVERRLLERRLLLLADIPGFNVKAELAPGARPGFTDLKVEVGGAPGVQGEFGFDNSGNSYTGRYRLSCGMQVVNPGGWGDLISLRALVSHNGLAYGRLSYQSAVGSDGWRLGAALSTLRYDLGRDYGNLGAEGDAGARSLSALYPVVRGVDANLYASLAWEETRLFDRVNATGAQSDKVKQTISAGLNGDWRAWGGDNQAHATLTAGNVALRTPAVQAQDALTARTAGAYARLNFGLVHARALTGGYNLHADLRGQLAGNNLDASEKLSLGGVAGVRAYPQGEAAGDDAFLLSVELRRYLGRVADGSLMQATLFADLGMSRINHSDWSSGSNRRTLSGAGAALGWGTRAHGATRIGLAFKLGGGAATADRDSPRRLWISYEEAF